MKIAIIGAGAMGCLFGAHLQPFVPGLILVDVWEEHVARINAGGLRLEKSGKMSVFEVSACLPSDLPFKPDVYILFTKTFHTRSALAAVSDSVSAASHLLTLQNGIGHTEIIEDYFDRSRIIHGITTYPCDLIGPGHIRTTGDGYIKLMSLDGHRYPILEGIEHLFNTSGLTCRITPDVSGLIWEKLAFNAAMNCTTALLKITVGQLADSVEGRKLVARIVAEVVEVASRLDLPIDPHRIQTTLDLAFREHRDHMPSMLQDVLKQRKTEIDFINGAIVKWGKKTGVATPVNESLYALIKTLESSYLPK